MTKVPPRWLDLHPGDMVIERIGTLAALQQSAKDAIPAGYRFTIGTFGDGFLVTCLESPRPLIGDRG
jgi:hypothetical protein